MAKFTYLIFLLLLMDICYCKRGGSSSWGRRGSSRGKTSTSSNSGGSSWFSWGSSSHSGHAAPAPAPAKPATNYGWTKPASAPSAPPAPPGGSSYGWSAPKPAAPGTNTAWQRPATNTQPHQNIGPGGYPVQQGVQKMPNPPAYTPTNPMGNPPAYPSNIKPPAYTPTNNHGSFNPGNTRVAPPAYSPSAPSYSGPKKQIINNHYHYGSPQSHGMSSAYYPQQNSFGYPGGQWGNSRPSYGGLNMFQGGNNGYGYSGGGGWGVPSYGSNNGGLVKGLLIGAATGYVANSLIRTVTNPWGYSGYGYGHGYMDRYRQDSYHDRRNDPTPAPAPVDPSSNWINCVAIDPVTKQTMINPKCTCTVSTTTDPATGQNLTHHDCTPYNPNPHMVAQPPFPGVNPGYGVNNPPPGFNQGSMHTGMGYGGGYPVAETAAAAAAVPAVQAVPVQDSGSLPTPTPPPSTVSPPVSQPQSEQLVAEAVHQQKAEFYTQLEKIVSMGRFSR